MYGCSLERALKINREITTDVIAVAFDKMISRIGVKHPWEDGLDAMEAVEEILERDLSWTLEDVALMFRMAARGKLTKAYDRIGEPWLEECLVAYANLKIDAMERKREKEKAYHEAEAMQIADPQFLQEPNRKPRVMAEFLGGKNYLTAYERGQMALRDEVRRAKQLKEQEDGRNQE